MGNLNCRCCNPVLTSSMGVSNMQGFCKPSKEATTGHSGATDFVDMEAGGFSEGSGEKNVSLQAEAENMVCFL